MITNDRQYRISKSQASKFKEALEKFSDIVFEDVHPILIDAQRSAMEFKLKELLFEVEEYEELKAGHIVMTEVKELKELPLILVKARIANGLTQSELAAKLGVPEQQIQRYEADKYETASLKTLFRIAEVLKIRIDADVQIKEVNSPEIYDIKKYPFKQMYLRKWFRNFTGSFNEAVMNSAELLADLFENGGLQRLPQAYNKKSVRLGSAFNEFALDAWYARIIFKARSQDLETFFDKNLVPDTWLFDLAKLSEDENGPRKAIEYLKNVGIRVVIEAHLEGTQLDGAALILDEIYPVIALTLRYDRLDNFWFVLFHEIAHVYLHLGVNYSIIFDDLDTTSVGIESEADQFALNALIPNNIWKKSVARFSPSKETIINQAKALKVNPALVAGRIRKETGKFYQFTELIGQGKVRMHFLDELNY